MDKYEKGVIILAVHMEIYPLNRYNNRVLNQFYKISKKLLT